MFKLCVLFFTHFFHFSGCAECNETAQCKCGSADIWVPCISLRPTERRPSVAERHRGDKTYVTKLNLDVYCPEFCLWHCQCRTRPLLVSRKNAGFRRLCILVNFALCVFHQEAGLRPNVHVFSALIGRASRKLDYLYLRTILKTMSDMKVWPNEIIIRQLEFAAQYPPNYNQVSMHPSILSTSIMIGT